MSGRNLESYLDDAEGFSALSEEEQSRLMAGGTLEGDTETEEVEEISETPDADPETSEEEQAAEEPVILAKDGQHTIPFSELETAREKARQLEQELIELRAGKPASDVPDTDSKPQSVDGMDEIAELRRQYKEAFFNGDDAIATELEKRIDAKVMEVAIAKASEVVGAREAQRQEQLAQERIISDANKRATALVEKYPFLDPEGPATNRKAIDLVVLQRDKFIAEGMTFADAIEKAVGEIAPLFEQATTTKQQPGADVAKKAAEAISKAQAKVPTSLSQVPAGARAHHDEGEAIRNMDINRLSRTFEGKSPDEIMKLMSRVL